MSHRATSRFGTQHNQAMTGYAAARAMPNANAAGRYNLSVTAANVSAKFCIIHSRCAGTSPARIERYARRPVYSQARAKLTNPARAAAPPYAWTARQSPAIPPTSTPAQ